MADGRLKSLGIDPQQPDRETIPYNPDTLKAIVATGKLV